MSATAGGQYDEPVGTATVATAHALGEWVCDDGWHLLNVFHTPAVLLDKGVILPRHNFTRL